MGVEIVDEPGKHRYEAHVDGAVAGYVIYAERPGTIVLIHTEVADGYEGQGIGGRLAAGVLDDIRARGLRVVPRCRFIAGWLERHPEYTDRVEGWE